MTNSLNANRNRRQQAGMNGFTRKLVDREAGIIANKSVFHYILHI